MLNKCKVLLYETTSFYKILLPDFELNYWVFFIYVKLSSCKNKLFCWVYAKIIALIFPKLTIRWWVWSDLKIRFRVKSETVYWKEKRLVLTVMIDWVLIPVLPLPSYVTLVKLLNFFEPSFHHLLNVEYWSWFQWVFFL